MEVALDTAACARGVWRGSATTDFSNKTLTCESCFLGSGRVPSAESSCIVIESMANQSTIKRLSAGLGLSEGRGEGTGMHPTDAND